MFSRLTSRHKATAPEPERSVTPLVAPQTLTSRSRATPPQSEESIAPPVPPRTLTSRSQATAPVAEANSAPLVPPRTITSRDKATAPVAEEKIAPLVSSKTWPKVIDQGNGQAASQIYGALEPWETRLLTLLPGLPEDALSVGISAAALTFEKGLGLVSEHRNVEYEALSYTWGDQTLSHELHCGSALLHVTANLATALVSLRHDTERRYLWVDALCINQRDNEEKASQIRNMKLIYGRASNVIVWLGLPGSDTLQAANFLNQVDLEHQLALLQEQRTGPIPADKEQQLQNIGDSFSSSFVTQHDAPAFNSTLRGLFDLGRRQWLSRVWILQEVYAASSITVRCGFCEIDWFAFSRLDSLTRSLAQAVHTYFSTAQADIATDSTRQERTDYLSHFTTTANSALSLTGEHTLIATDEVDAMIKKFHYLRLTRSRREKHNDDQDRTTFSLLELLVQGTHLQATDDRDRIFALLGLTLVPTFHDRGSHNGENGIRISYNRTVPEVFEEVTKFIMLLVPPTTILTALCTRGIVASKSSDIDLPSWCPDWRNIHPSFLLPFSPEWVPAGRLGAIRQREADILTRLRESHKHKLHRVRTKSPSRKELRRRETDLSSKSSHDSSETFTKKELRRRETDLSSNSSSYDSNDSLSGHFFQQDPNALGILKTTGWRLGSITEVIPRYSASAAFSNEIDTYAQVGVQFTDWVQGLIVQVATGDRLKRREFREEIGGKRLVERTADARIKNDHRTRVNKLHEFALQTRVWAVVGKPQVGDLIVYPRRAIYPLVYRVFHGCYRYVGAALLAESVSPLKDYYRQRYQQSDIDAFRKITEEFLKLLPDTISSDDDYLLDAEEPFDLV